MRRITDEFDPIPQGFCGLKDRDGQSDDCTSCADDIHRWSRWTSGLGESVGGTVHRLGAVEARASVPRHKVFRGTKWPGSRTDNGLDIGRHKGHNLFWGCSPFSSSVSESCTMVHMT